MVAFGLGSALTALLVSEDPAPVRVEVAATEAQVIVPSGVADYPATARTTDIYSGLGAWLDAFDYSPAYGADGIPPVDSTVVAEMAASGVETIYLRACCWEPAGPDALEDRWVLAEYLMAARQEGVAVVGGTCPSGETTAPTSLTLPRSPTSPSSDCASTAWASMSNGTRMASNQTSAAPDWWDSPGNSAIT